MDDFKIIFQLYVGPKIENLTIFANLNFIFIKTNFIKKNNLCSDFWQCKNDLRQIFCRHGLQQRLHQSALYEGGLPGSSFRRRSLGSDRSQGCSLLNNRSGVPNSLDLPSRQIYDFLLKRKQKQVKLRLTMTSSDKTCTP